MPCCSGFIEGHEINIKHLALLAAGGILVGVLGGGAYFASLSKIEQAKLLLKLFMPGGETLFQVDAIDYPRPGPLLGWIDSRDKRSLNGEWSLIVDPLGIGSPGSIFGGYALERRDQTGLSLIEYDFESAQKIKVPGDFNTQDERLFFYRDKLWLQRTFNMAAPPEGRQLLYFGAANFDARVFLNGVPIGRHSGGYVPFHFDVTAQLKRGQNTLLVWIDNRLDASTVPTDRTDWWPYGGLIRDVYLVSMPAEGYIRNAKLSLAESDPGRIEIAVDTEHLPRGAEISIDFPELEVVASMRVNSAGRAHTQIVAAPELWSPASPKRYEVVIRAGADEIRDEIGFRTIETRGTQILLNGSALKLKGISTHEEPIGAPGMAHSAAHMRRLLDEVKALGANFVRAAHYPYNRHLARLADEMGLMLWEEIPLYWQIDWSNERTLDIASGQLRRLVERDWNRASVIIWSVANETPATRARLRALRQLIRDLRALDDTRLVSAALLGGSLPDFALITARLAARGLKEPNLPTATRAIFNNILDQAGYFKPSAEDGYALLIDDALGRYVDVIAYNEYFGWYYSAALARQLGVEEALLRRLMLDFIADLTIEAAYDKPIHISEFGAGAKYGRSGGAAHIWSEEYQAAVYRAQLGMLRNSPQVQGMSPWILKDFRSMMRPLAGVQDYYNRKGLIDEQGRRKQAFFILRDFYRQDWLPARRSVKPLSPD